MTLTIIEYGGVTRQIKCESFEFRCNQVTNWIEVRKEDGTKELIHNICVIKTVPEFPSAENTIIRCKDCEWWDKLENSLQGRCCLMRLYSTGEWYCANARRAEREEV